MKRFSLVGRGALLGAALLSILPLQAASAHRTAPASLDRAGEPRLCVRDRAPNSRILRNYCRTSQEWESRGGSPMER